MSSHTGRPFSRRTTLAGLGAAGLTLALTGHDVAAQDATPADMAGHYHPLVGT